MKDLRSITDPAAGSGARRAGGSEIAHAISGFEPMTAVSFCSVTVSADAPSALCRLTRSVRCAGLMPRTFAASSRRDEASDVEDLFAEAFHFGVTGPSVVRSGAADSEVAPQWSALVVCCRLP